MRASLGIGEMGNMGVSLHLCMSKSLLVRSATHRRRSPCSFRLPHGCRRQCPILLCVPAACGWKTNVEKLAACQRSPCLPKWQKLLAAELVREALDSSIAARWPPETLGFKDLLLTSPAWIKMEEQRCARAVNNHFPSSYGMLPRSQKNATLASEESNKFKFN